MRTLIRYAARLYPPAWRNRYAGEFDALLEDMSPSLGDLCDVLGDVLRVRVTTSVHAALMLAPASSMTLCLPVFASLIAQAAIITIVLFTIWGHTTTLPFHIIAPLPPPAPEPPAQVTDARVFPNAQTLYSSLPLSMPAPGQSFPIYVANGVGINFLSLPDIGATYRQGNAEWRVWPGQALERFIIRRPLPEYPRGANTAGAASVFVEYLITRDGSVKLLRTSGPALLTWAAQSAIEHWVYRPLECDNRPCEVVTRVEVRFDGANSSSNAK
jgi:Gram-negative bacterial TonB protein C-terminal